MASAVDVFSMGVLICEICTGAWGHCMWPFATVSWAQSCVAAAHAAGCMHPGGEIKCPNRLLSPKPAVMPRLLAQGSGRGEAKCGCRECRRSAHRWVAVGTRDGGLSGPTCSSLSCMTPLMMCVSLASTLCTVANGWCPLGLPIQPAPSIHAHGVLFLPVFHPVRRKWQTSSHSAWRWSPASAPQPSS